MTSRLSPAHSLLGKSLFLFFTFTFLFTFQSLAQPIYDDCSGIVDLGEAPICPFPETFTNVDATLSEVFSNPSDNVPTCFVGNPERDVWFQFSVPASGAILDFQIEITGIDGPNGSIQQPQVAIYRGDCFIDELQELACATSAAGEDRVELDVTGLTPGLTYFLRVNDWSGSATPNWGDFEVCVKEPPMTPDDLPWDPHPVCESIITDGIAAVTCGVTVDVAPDEQWTFGLMDIRETLPAAGRVDITADVEMYHHPSWDIDSIGNVFGITMDRSGNTYIAASSNYGAGYFLNAGVIRYGDIGGGAESVDAAGTIYKIDGLSGQASVFTVLPQQASTFEQTNCEGVENVTRNTGPALGNLVFSPTTKQFYVTNFEDGRIYRLDENGVIIDTYDPFNLDSGAPGTPTLDELAYGLDILADGSALFFGNAGSTFGGTLPSLHSIELNSDGSFIGTIDNSANPTGSTWDNYVGDETFHITLELPFLAFGGDMQSVSDMEFTPNGELLIGIRSGCNSSIHNSYNHGGQVVRLSLNAGTGLYEINDGNIFTGYEFSIGQSSEAYGGVSVYTDPDGNYQYTLSSADILEEGGPHGICLLPEGVFGAPLAPAEPAGAINYGFDVFFDDPKGVGGDVKVFVACEEVVVPEDCIVDAGPDITICAPGQDVTLSGSIVSGPVGSVEWTPAAGLSDPTSLTPTVFVSTTTTFTMTGIGQGTDQNIIVNGDFSDGDTGFTSDYIVGTGGPFGQLSDEGTYAVTTNSSLVHNNWAACEDNTGGGSMLAVNGATTANENIWCQTVAVEPNTTYEFSAWLASFISENPAILQFSINGDLIGNPLNAPVETCIWEQFFSVWESGANTSAEICITNQNTQGSGNDFGIDDISFGAVCQVSDEVTVFVNDPVAEVVPEATITCASGGFAVLDGTGSTTGSDVTYLWTTTDGNIVSGETTLNPTVDQTGTYTLTVSQESDFDPCIATAEVLVNEDTTTLDLPDVVEICLGGSYTFDVPGFAIYQWSPTDFLSCTDCPNPTATPTETITYTLTVISADSCEASASTQIVVLPAFETSLELEACEGETVTYNGTELEPGSVTEFDFVTTEGCDSTVTVTVIGLPTFADSISFEACEGDTFEYNGVPLDPGSVTDFTFTAANGCDSIVTVTIIELPNVETSESISICFGETVEIFGIPTGTAGTYEMTFPSSNGCDSTHTVELTVFDEVIVSATATDVSCFGGSDGTVSASATGGTAPFTYEWSTGDMGSDVNGLPAGDYSVTATDANGCTGEAIVTIGQPTAVEISVVGENVSCDELGSASASASGGTPDYTYEWSTGATTSEITDLEAGVYTVTATDANGCTDEASVEITGALGPDVSISIDQLPSEDDPESGALTATITGGTAPFTVEWSNGDTELSIDSLPSGEYIVTITDANGCTATAVEYIFLPGCTGGKIWNDRNRDGCQMGGELGIGGIELELMGTDIWGNDISMTTVTAINGEYIFEPLPPGDYQVFLPTPPGYVQSPMDNCADDFVDSDFNEDNLSFVVDLAEGHCCLIVDGGLYDECLNVYDPGSICCDQIICGPGVDPAPITSVEPAVGAVGAVEYMWMYSNSSPSFSNGYWTGIPGTNSPSYDPGPLSETTYFARCVRAVGCTEWLETNVVEIFVDDDAVAKIDGPNSVCVGDDAVYSAYDNGPGATYSWNFGPWATPSTATGQEVEVTWNQAGIVYITLSVTANGCTSTTSYGLAVSDSPIFCGSALGNPNSGNTGYTAMEGEVQFEVYPNPVSDFVNIKWNQALDAPMNVQLKAIDGRQLLFNKIDGNNLFHQTDISQMASGIYLLEVEYGDGERQTFKVVKE